MKLTLSILLSFICLACKGQKETSLKNKENTISNKQEVVNKERSPVKVKKIESLQEFIKNRKLTNYTSAKQYAEVLRVKAKKDSTSILFEEALLHTIIPFWEGTEWSFEGHTAKPKTGYIACGYFVSTTLKDAGVNINRYQLAQQSPINEAKTVALKNELIEIAEETVTENIQAISKILPEGIHFIGFDQSHVGYILKEKGELYLIHSNYMESKGVEIEKIEESMVFSSYARFYIVEISTNKNLLDAWVHQKEIKVIKE